MASIEKMIATMEAVNISAIVADAMYNTKNDIIQLQVEQMYSGKRSDGKLIGKYKNKVYAAKKYSLNPLAGFGNVDLRLTGDFQDYIIADVRENSVVFSSEDDKTIDLVEKYSDDIFGLSTPYAKEYATNYLGPEGIKLIKKKFNLK
jgi:hypothetical protein